jgi:predicted RNA-binding Zn-ribbon protein involved in translation (DUF1610 family)
MMEPCIYCGRPRIQHKNSGDIEIIDGNGRCCPGFTTREELNKPNLFTYGTVAASLREAYQRVLYGADTLSRSPTEGLSTSLEKMAEGLKSIIDEIDKLTKQELEGEPVDGLKCPECGEQITMKMSTSRLGNRTYFHCSKCHFIFSRRTG